MREHIVRSFEEELRHVSDAIARMGALTEAQLGAACQLVAAGEPERLARTLAADGAIDALELGVSNGAMRLLALRQPMAVDLRETLAAIRIATDLERIGDLAKNVAKRSGVVHRTREVEVAPALIEMGRQVRRQLSRVVGAYVDRDAERARGVWLDDQQLDDGYESLVRELLTHMLEDPRTIGANVHLLFIAKNLERVGDHCANIGASVYYVVCGERLTEARPKGADARMLVVEPPRSA